MIRQNIRVEHYWEVIVYYNIDYGFFPFVAESLREVNCPPKEIEEIFYNLSNSALAFTFSNTKLHKSIVGFRKHTTKLSYINSIVHEAEHVKQAMLEAYNIEDVGEPPAYTMGYLVSEMLKVNNQLNII